MNDSESPLDRDDIRLLGEIARKQEDKEKERLKSASKQIEQDEKILMQMAPEGRKEVRHIYNVLAVVIALVLMTVLLLTVTGLPSFGREENPTNNEVPERYLNQGLEEGGATNLVANMILDYRAFDTLGESNVLFIAVCSVIILLRINSDDPREVMQAEADDRHFEPKNDIILQMGARILMPVMMLYGMYIVFLYCAIFLGEVRSFYYGVPHWDVILHAFSSLMLGFFGFMLITILNRNEKTIMNLSPIFTAVFSLCFAIAFGTIWEIYEFTIDSTLGLNMQKYITADGTVLAGRAALWREVGRFDGGRIPPVDGRRR